MQNKIKAYCRYLSAFARWTLIAVLIGAVCGVIGGVFALAVEHATHLREQHPWLLYLLPAGGLIIALVYRAMKLPLSLGTDEIITTVRTQGGVPVLMAPAIFIATTLTHLFGGSSGREGAALQLGGSLGAAIGRLLRPKEDLIRICQLCGMAALFSALFGTPLTATIFVLEIIEVGRIYERAMLPCLVSAVTAMLCARAVGVHKEPFFLAAGLQAVNAAALLQALGLGVICAVTAILFCMVMHFSGKRVRRLIRNDFLRIAAGGAAVILLALVLGTRDYLGGGMQVIFAALDGSTHPEAFLLKILFTAVTLSCGFKGGEIVPSFFIGATLGCAAAPLLGMPAQLGAGLGLISVFCGVTNAPIASLMLSIELFGAEYLPLFGVSALTAFMLSGHISLYHAQLFTEPKLGHRI